MDNYVFATWKGNNVEPMLTIPFLRNKYKQTVTKEVSLFSLMQFLGYYLSEGSAHTYQIRIFQAENSEHLNEIRLLLKSLPFDVKETISHRVRLGSSHTPDRVRFQWCWS